MYRSRNVYSPMAGKYRPYAGIETKVISADVLTPTIRGNWCCGLGSQLIYDFVRSSQKIPFCRDSSHEHIIGFYVGRLEYLGKQKLARMVVVLGTQTSSIVVVSRVGYFIMICKRRSLEHHGSNNNTRACHMYEWMGEREW